MSETYTLYKLIVLYMLDKVDFPLTTSQISEFILEKEYTTYFKLQETLAEMEHSGFPLPFSGILMNFSKKRSMI